MANMMVFSGYSKAGLSRIPTDHLVSSFFSQSLFAPPLRYPYGNV